MDEFKKKGKMTEELSPLYDGKTGKWGYVNIEGKYVIELQFDEAFPFSEGLARAKVKIGDKYFYINNEGQIVYGYE
ncbi:MAG: WG repeat-containing protein [candidate division WOR-3 bacterium]